MSGNGLAVVPKFPKWYLCRTELFKESGTGHTGGIYRLYASLRTVPSTAFTTFWLQGESDYYMGENILVLFLSEVGSINEWIFP